jgi:hypothetical protein
MRRIDMKIKTKIRAGAVWVVGPAVSSQAVVKGVGVAIAAQVAIAVGIDVTPTIVAP